MIQFLPFEQEYKVFYHPIQPQRQSGPTCGLVTLIMAQSLLTQPLPESELLLLSQSMGISKRGEIFSAVDFCQLAQMIGMKAHCISFCELVIKKWVMRGGVVAVPYDSDKNDEPYLNNGHSAHWCLIFGLALKSSTFIVTPKKDEFLNADHVLIQHGKSNYTRIWDLQRIRESNANLNETRPNLSEKDYHLPTNGNLCQLKGNIVLIETLQMKEELFPL